MASRLEQLVYLGQDQGDPLRVEVTRLPGTKRIDLNGTPVDAVKMQFLATSGTAILEVAIAFANARDVIFVAGAGNDDFATRSQRTTSLEPVSDRTCRHEKGRR